MLAVSDRYKPLNEDDLRCETVSTRFYFHTVTKATHGFKLGGPQRECR